MNQHQKPKRIVITQPMRHAIGYALDLAFDDQEHYLKCGNPKTDYSGDWEEARRSKADKYRALAKLGDRLSFQGEADRWNRLADDLARWE